MKKEVCSMSEVLRGRGGICEEAILDLDSASESGCAFSVVKSQQFAHVYMPIQMYHRSLPLKEALVKGTLFPELWGVYPIPE
ncbi:MAG: spore coat associated protein CotJA [Selenomonadales bacterium]|nr:spore coat associated protein CotJA [Selenomonadales bacterium]